MRRPAATPLDPPLRERFARALAESFGLAFPLIRQSHLDAGVRRAATTLGEPAPESLLHRIERGDPVALEHLAMELTVGETYFFRDGIHFDFLRRALLARANDDRPIRLWSAGCATGEEAYSMAIVAREVLGAKRALEVLGTDVNTKFLAKAREGRYGAWSFRNVPEEVRARSFTREASKTWLVDGALRELVRFEPMNFADPCAETWPRDIDVIFCRNVLIYFDATHVTAVAERLAESLAPGGSLVTGPSDPLLHVGRLEIVREPGLVAYRSNDAAHAVTPSAEGVSAPIEPWLAVAAPSIGPATPPPAHGPEAEEATPGAPSVASTRPPFEEGEDALLRARSLANAGEHAAAHELLDRRVAGGSIDPETYVLRASLRLEDGDPEGAARDARSAILLDRRLAIAHVVSAAARAALGDVAGALRDVRNARALLAPMPADDAVPHGGGATAEQLLASCRRLERSLASRAGTAGGTR